MKEGPHASSAITEPAMVLGQLSGTLRGMEKALTEIQADNRKRDEDMNNTMNRVVDALQSIARISERQVNFEEASAESAKQTDSRLKNCHDRISELQTNCATCTLAVEQGKTAYAILKWIGGTVGAFMLLAAMGAISWAYVQSVNSSKTYIEKGR